MYEQNDLSFKNHLLYFTGIIQNQFLLADEPVQGSWIITVNDKNDTQTTTFDVKEYSKISVQVLK